MATGDIVTTFTVDKRQLEGGLALVKKDLAGVRKEIALIAPAAAAGNKEAFTTLVSLVGVEEHLADVARHSAEAEAQARRLVVGQVREQIVEEKRLEDVQSRRSITFGSKSGASGGGGFGGSRATFALLELSRGAEDAAVSFGTAGLAGAFRGAANNAAAMATIIHPMAGVVVGLGAALGSVLIPRLLETETAADKAKKSLEGLSAKLEQVKSEREAAENLTTLRSHNTEEDKSNQATALEEQRKKVAEVRKEYGDLQTSLRELTQQLTIMDKLHGESSFFAPDFDKERREDIRRQITENEKKLREAQGKLTTEEGALNAGERIANRGKKREYLTEGSSLAQDQEYRKRLRNEREAEQNTARMEQQRIASIAAESMQRSLVSGLTSKLGGLQRQREGLLQSPRSFNLPSLATRGNSIDKQIEMSQAKKEAVAESQRKMQIEKLEKMIDLTEKLLDEAKNSPTLKPARVG